MDVLKFLTGKYNDNAKHVSQHSKGCGIISVSTCLRFKKMLNCYKKAKIQICLCIEIRRIY